jgi:hypothetical protein
MRQSLSKRVRGQIMPKTIQARTDQSQLGRLGEKKDSVHTRRSRDDTLRRLEQNSTEKRRDEQMSRNEIESRKEKRSGLPISSLLIGNISNLSNRIASAIIVGFIGQGRGDTSDQLSNRSGRRGGRGSSGGRRRRGGTC